MDRPVIADERLPKWAVIGTLWLWFTIALLTHYGARSPYSYAGGVLGFDMRRIDGLVVNHDAPSVRPVTEFLYDAREVDFAKAHNLKLPLHSLLVATTASYLRSYTLANYLVNLLALWLLSCVVVTYAESLAYPRAAMLLASLTCALLPVYTHYIGQPMHYVLGIVVNFLVMIALMAGVRDPLRAGILTALLTLSYDPYVFIATVVTWILIRLRWTRVLDWGIYVATALLPVVLWRAFLGTAGGKAPSGTIRDSFLVPVFDGWRAILTAPHEHLLAPFVNGHVGLAMAVQMTLAVVYWPVLVLCVAGWVTRRSEGSSLVQVPALLAGFFVLEQLATAIYDWENNPRRAIPLLFAVSCAYFVVVRAKAHVRGWRMAFVAVAALCAILTMSDTLLNKPVVGYMATGEAMRGVRPEVLRNETELDPLEYPKLMRDERPRWWDVGSARPARPLTLLFAHLYLSAFVVGLLVVLRERALVPRFLPHAVGAVLVLSLGARLL